MFENDEEAGGESKGEESEVRSEVLKEFKEKYEPRLHEFFDWVSLHHDEGVSMIMGVRILNGLDEDGDQVCATITSVCAKIGEEDRFTAAAAILKDRTAALSTVIHAIRGLKPYFCHSARPSMEKMKGLLGALLRRRIDPDKDDV